MRDRFDVAFANDPDADRHGIVTRGAGLMNPNHYLAACDRVPVRRRARLGRATRRSARRCVSSSMIDRVGDDLGRRLVEVPVGFKWFVDGLLDGSLGFGGEESAGASFLRRDGTAVDDGQGRADPVPARGGDDGPTGARPGRGLRRADRALRRAGLPARSTRRPPPSEKAVLEAALARAGRGRELAGEPIGDNAHRGARQRRADRRAEGRRRARLVRRAAVGHGGRLQALRGEPATGEEHLERILAEAQQVDRQSEALEERRPMAHVLQDRAAPAARASASRR